MTALEELLERLAPSVQTDANPAKQLAWSMFGRIPVVYGHGGWPRRRTGGRPSSTRTRRPGPPGSRCRRPTTTRSRGASTPASYRTPCTSSRFATRRAGRDRERYRVVEELLGERATNRSAVWAEGLSPLARVPRAVAYGDMVSCYLAILYQTDPTPVTLLAMLKGGSPGPPDPTRRAPGQGAGGSGAMEVPATCIRA